jgi:hypothetical protein
LFAWDLDGDHNRVGKRLACETNQRPTGDAQEALATTPPNPQALAILPEVDHIADPIDSRLGPDAEDALDPLCHEKIEAGSNASAETRDDLLGIL